MKNWFRALRDFFIPFLPVWAVRALVPKYDFAFVGHPLVLEDLSRQYPNLKNVSKNVLKIISQNLWPVLGSEIRGFYDRTGKEIKGIVLFCPMSTRIMVLHQKKAVRKLLKIVKMAEALGVKIIGLGAFVPIVTYDGKLLAKDCKVSMTTGTSFSAVIAFNNALRLAERCGLDMSSSTVAIVGAGGSVGSICSRLFFDHVRRLILIDRKLDRIGYLLKGDYFTGVQGIDKKISFFDKLAPLKEADLVIVTTNTPGTVIHADHLPVGCLVVDAAQPRNVSAKVPYLRKDVAIVESGVARVKGLNTHFEFDLHGSDEVYSCLAEVLILQWLGMDGKQVGKFSIPYVLKLKETAEKVGIHLPPFRNRSGELTNQYLDDISEIIRSKRRKLFARPVSL